MPAVRQRGDQALLEYTERFDGVKLTDLEVTAAEIDAYIATGECMDKAGAYGIQGRAALMVRRLEGDYFNVMGLPLCRLGQMLEEIGVHLF